MHKLCWQAISSEMGQESQKQSLGARVLLASDLIGAGPRSRSRVSLRAFCWQVISSTELGRSRSRVSVRALCWQEISSELGREKQKQSLGAHVLLASDLVNGAGKEAESQSACSVGK